MQDNLSLGQVWEDFNKFWSDLIKEEEQEDDRK